MESEGYTSVTLDNIPEMANHCVSTEREKIAHRGMSHKEGGWPKDIDPTDPQDTTKWRKRVDKDPQFSTVLKQLVSEVQSVIDENNTMDMFEDYFAGETVDHQMCNLSASTVAVFKDQVPEEYRRCVSKISWHPDGPHRFIASYSSPTGAMADEDAPKSSFVWETQNPNVPYGEILTPSPLTCTAYYPKNAELVSGGTHSGLIMYYDLRTGWKPVNKSGFEKAHWGAVSEFIWLSSKTHSEAVSCGTDGRVLWWDVRNMKEPTDIVVLAPTEGTRPFGACSMEWQQEAGPTKYLIGTEEGVMLTLNKKPKKPVEFGGYHGFEERGGSGKHAGPIYSVKRNPFHAKYFLSFGDWSVKLWLDELKGPLYQTTYAPALLTCGGWSPSRAGVFYACRADGVIDFYDYYFRMNEVAYSHKIGNAKLTAASISGGLSTAGQAVPSIASSPYGKSAPGSLMAVGDVNGEITLIRLCEELAVPSSTEKTAVGAILERETKREKNLDGIRKQLVQAKGAAKSQLPTLPPDDSVGDENVYLERESNWLKSLGIQNADDNTLKRQF